MSELVNRLRGLYPIGPDGVYGTRDFSNFIPPICKEAADEIERLNARIKDYQDACAQKQEIINGCTQDIESLTARIKELEELADNAFRACADDCASAIRNQLSGSANQLRKEDE